MEYKIATEKEIVDIYNNYMVKDFPPAELKPLGSILSAVEKGWYVVHTFYDGDLKCYANVADCGKIKFLDYFAVNEKERGRGIGSKVFKALSEKLEDCIVLEVESIESAPDEKTRELRKKRIEFYKRNGCVDTGCVYNVFGVEYNVFINKNIEISEMFLAELLSAYEYAYAAILRRDDKSFICRVK